MTDQKPAGIYRVLANHFTYPFHHGGTRAVKRNEEVRLTAEEATTLSNSPTLVFGPKPGTEEAAPAPAESQEPPAE